MVGSSEEAGPSTQRSSRITVVSLQGLPEPSLVQLVHSITDGEAQTKTAGVEDDSGSSSFVTHRDSTATSTIPWTIDNRYYTSEVHFKVASVHLPLNNVGSIRRKQPSEQTQEDTRRLREELRDVQAVVVVVQVDSSMGLTEHQTLLDQLDSAGSAEGEERDSMPMAFGLAISVVVALPAPMDASKPLGAAAAEIKREQLVELYADHGWEYVDLVDGMGAGALTDDVDDHLTLEDDQDKNASSRGSNDEEEDEVTGETKGLARVKEALEANLWPSLIRKDSSQGSRKQRQASMSSPDSARQSPVSWLARRVNHLMSTDDVINAGNPTDANDDDEIEAMFRNLDLNLPSSGLSSLPTDGAHAEPTAQDEDLARRFLASISDFEKQHSLHDDGRSFDLNALLSRQEPQNTHTLPESEADRKAHQEEALKRLEQFLQSEDVDWPGEAGQGAQPLTSNALAFEDDFDEFVKAPVAQSTKREEEDDGNEWLERKEQQSEDTVNQGNTTHASS